MPSKTEKNCLLVLFRLLLRRREPFETLQQLLLGHPLHRHFGVVGLQTVFWLPNMPIS